MKLQVLKSQLLAVFMVTGLVLYASTTSAQATAPTSLTNVRALVYSTTAAELQWSRRDSERVQVTYNDQVLGQFEANSLYRGNLDPRMTHRFELRAVDAGDRVSAPLFLSFTTGDFQPPIRQVLPDQQAVASVQSSGTASTTSSDTGTTSGNGNTPNSTDGSMAGDATLSAVRALVYSKTAAELMWSRNDAARVQVSYNGRSLGSLDTNSLFQTGLDPNTRHRFELLALNASGAAGSRYVLEFSTGDSDGQIRTVQGSTQGTAVTPAVTVAVSRPVMSTDNEADSEPVDAPTSEPVTEPLSVPVSVPQADAPATSGTPVSVRDGDCVVRSVTQLLSCAQAAAGYSRINIQSDLSCTGASCCPAGGALVDLSNVSNLSIEGNGHRLLRTSGQRQCSLLDINGASTVSITNWRLDDDARVQPCQVSDQCPRMLHIRNSSDISLERVSVTNGKSYVIYVQRVNGFRFVDSSLTNSGVLGLYVGHPGSTSTNVRIQNSTFTDNQTNAVALLGVTGSSRTSNLVSDNVFKRNHYRGQFPVAPRYGTGFTGGGQVYIAEASGLTISGNDIADGYCENCFVQQRYGSGVSGIELARPGMNSVTNTLITSNTVSNHDAWGIFVNEGSTLDRSVEISNNRLLDNTVGLKPAGTLVSGNIIQDR